VTVLLLIRHGQTDWLGKKLAGRLPGISLNATGRAEAARIADSLSRMRLAAVYSSPLERARETAEPIARQQDLEIQFTDALLEVEFGSLTGKTFEELKTIDVWKQLHVDPARTSFPGGESLAAVQQRAVQWVEQTARSDEARRIAAVSHADTIRLVLAHYLSMPLVAFHSLLIDPAAVSILRFEKKIVRVIGVNWPASAAGEEVSE
jgi:broad specificity phosphatase PhoE